jgi:death-on-curing protein
VSQWKWLQPLAIFALHDRQLAEHGGLPGVRDENALQSALARPQQQANNGDPDAAALAAEYALGLAPTRGFHDGNKRVAWLAANIFLGLNGYVLKFIPMEAVRIMESTAEGIISGEELAAWFRNRLNKTQDSK